MPNQKSEFKHLFSGKNRLDIWQLRAKGLERQLNNNEWARVLYHIAKRRAYQSNRKSEEIGNLDKKKVLSAIETNQEVVVFYDLKLFYCL
jgi:CRISPR-associated endonuclease Csn1